MEEDTLKDKFMDNIKKMDSSKETKEEKNIFFLLIMKDMNSTVDAKRQRIATDTNKKSKEPE